MIIRVSGPGYGPPCKGAVLGYGEWKQTKKQVFDTFLWEGTEYRLMVALGRYILEDILRAPDNDAKRNAVLDGDYVVYERREKFWQVEISTLEELVAILGDTGKFYADDGPYIELYE